MKKSAKERVFDELTRLTGENESVTAEQLSKNLGLSRQNVSHYLTRLMEDKQVNKIPGKPVLWQPAAEFDVRNSPVANQAFRSVIGFDGSLRDAIQKCISAVKYPPNGLSILINGATGVGKSFLATKIFEYALVEGVIVEGAPFAILNCADYADNPELLSATLFGYKKGAFTGAEKDTAGLLATADNGYLFLDEVHRLSKENQEKLFLFMDTGKYRPVGENVHWSSSEVRFIFATTEKNEDFLLETFNRRIQITIQLPTFEERPIQERLALIQQSFQNEAEILQKDILVLKEALSLLLFYPFSGNIGRLKNLIKISCADIYSRSTKEPLAIEKNEIATQLGDEEVDVENVPLSDLVIKKNQAIQLDQNKWADCDDHLAKIVALSTQGDFDENFPMIQKETQHLLQLIDQNSFLSMRQKLLIKMYRDSWMTTLEKKYGLTKSGPAAEITSRAYVFLPTYGVDLAQANRSLSISLPRTAYLSERFLDCLPALSDSEKSFLRLLILVTLSDYVDESIELKGLLLAHGDSTASSIQTVVNQLCGNYVFEALDMPIESNVSEIVELTKDFIKKQVHTDSLVLIVDMGSLNQIYTQIKNDLKGELLLLNNLTTSIALDIGLKMMINAPFNQIAVDATEKYSINAQYFEGFSQTSNIIISCMSGLGISDKLKEVFRIHLADETVEVFTKDYRELRKLIDQNDVSYFAKTKLVLTTSDLPKSFEIPNINVYDILDGEGAKHLESLLINELSQQDFNNLLQELVKFFSLEGIANRLNFLNPDIVMNEVETAISKYENYYHFTLNGRIKLNLYMHTALMMERLFLSRTEKAEELPYKLTNEQEEFYYVSRSIFQSMEMKYNFKVNAYELSLLYELMGPNINK
ncbi:sigma 54-interacting transcriptional regulator [Enterococcus faecium]|nr:sigma 54-interacting transcriptional regulator [Enterococcus faecium]EKZ0059230.1 sigma 54-interacting transcriptional regulator [Enterococcus faecium]HBK5036566.1 sigma 54-interacting transcriptional regulator [Enterococcus faecium]HBK5135196.1 sigma 54-interacting transcriptional regulator [Enterococcus faecium]HBK5141443.1 sigma 54-interacting transcriptional regulator [Enterococcus faecium]